MAMHPVICAICRNPPIVGLEFRRGRLSLCDECYTELRRAYRPWADSYGPFTSADSFSYKGRQFFSVLGVPGLNPRTLKDQIVVLDGKTVRVLGVETYALVDPIGQPFSLLVEEACSGDCNPYEADCGAKFCSYEEMAAHVRQHGGGK